MEAARSPRLLLPKIPTVGRYFVRLLVFAAFAGAARAEEPPRVRPLTENEVVTRALGRTPLAETIEGAIAVEEGRARSASAFSNPELAYVREETFGAFGTGEGYLTLSQTVDLGNRRGLRGEAGDARALAARREGDAARVAVAAEARQRFYDVLYRQSRVAALDDWVRTIEHALGIVTRREQRGDAAIYERRRLERERSVARGRLATEQAAHERAQARLQAILGAAAPPFVATGSLLPDADPAALTSLRTASASRPDFLALDLRIEAASRDRAAASRWWLPELRVEGGWKEVDLGGQGRSDGFLLGAALSLPLWDRASGEARSAEGEARAARGRRALLESEVQGELGGARAEAVRLRHAATAFREQTASAASDLMRVAAAGYEGGELGLLELLDAYRGAADDSLAALDLEYLARRARIDLDRLTGGGLR
jgi:outer membrane protein, heavy metal efflux system